ncbi:RNA polymerase sigma-70 factor [Mucilaginibacter sabulilitoris]|uniref:RNA polymerase sigma-70 factor n=1 Tax=Mucilaginibacter sabulilitoris TaxID=1173583 RepID=A0ABZ0TG97_9SPHI|nr:RNA polymerase sigma-70 factor [Mucilaginibacter sabulilitoris]WPU91611.1 RNA polymerase sigma-70 factor [Mucilaginibacter sabulilitoris]
MSPLTTLTDIELADLIKSGSQPAFQVVYNRYWRLLYGHIYKMLRDEEDAKDILQDVFSGLWLYPEKIPELSNLAGYLYTIARHKVLNAIRKNKYRNDYLESLAIYVSEASEETLQYIDTRDLMAAIEKEIAALPPRMRQVFELSRKENLSHKEIGKLLGTSDETVKKQINKSLKVIRYNLKESGGTALLLLALWR